MPTALNPFMHRFWAFSTAPSRSLIFGPPLLRADELVEHRRALLAEAEQWPSLLDSITLSVPTLGALLGNFITGLLNAIGAIVNQLG